jgi:hypothetical protein
MIYYCSAYDGPATTQDRIVNFEGAIEIYLTDMQRRHATGATTSESSYYGPLENLLNAIGGSLTPKVLCVGQLGNVGGGQPDFGLFTTRQLQKGRPAGRCIARARGDRGEAARGRDSEDRRHRAG